MDERRLYANCGSADHHVADCTSYKQDMKSFGFAPDEEDISHNGRTRVIQWLDYQKRREVVFSAIKRATSGWIVSFFWEAVKSQSLPKHKLALAAVQNIRKRKAENDLQTIEATSSELTIKVVKAVTEVRDVRGPRQGVH